MPSLSLLSAVLFVLAFPRFNISWTAWIALSPLAVYAIKAAPRPPSSRWTERPFFIGWFAGFIAYTAIFYWMVTTFRAAHQSVWLAILSITALSAYLALFWGAWVWLLVRFAQRPSWLAALGGGAAWAGLEYVRTLAFSGFPWVLLADSQVGNTSFIQLASVTGAYGLSFVVAGAAVAFGTALARREIRLFAGTLLAIGLIHLGGFQRVRHAPPPDPLNAITVALLQGNIDQYKKWNDEYVLEIQTTYEKLAKSVAEYHPQLVVWPETSVPGYLMQDPALRGWLDRVVKETGGYHLAGAPVFHDRKAYNSAFLLTPNAELLGEYAKQHLVPFGEMVPFGTILGRWINVLNELGGFAPGTAAPVLTTGRYKIGINICYEAIFPALVRRSVHDGGQIIANITNDGWYMQTAAPFQHFAPNILRAVENGRWLVRANNTGISGIVDPYGRVVSQTPIFQPMALTGVVYPKNDLTLYTRFGDAFAWLCALFCAILLTRCPRPPKTRS